MTTTAVRFGEDHQSVDVNGGKGQGEDGGRMQDLNRLSHTLHTKSISVVRPTTRTVKTELEFCRSFVRSFLLDRDLPSCLVERFIPSKDLAIILTINNDTKTNTKNTNSQFSYGTSTLLESQSRVHTKPQPHNNPKKSKQEP